MEELKAETESRVADSVSRRAFLSRLTATGLGVSAMGLAATAEAATLLKLPTALRAPHMERPRANNEKQFRAGLLDAAELSLASSKIARSKAVDLEVREFARFEMAEALAMTDILRQLRTHQHGITPEANATLSLIVAAPQGRMFDTAYMSTQLENHACMQELAQTYLNNSAEKSSSAELHMRHLATMMLATCEQHLALNKRILATLQV
jgi:putative membrane protein